jgi:hypothetical protein
MRRSSGIDMMGIKRDRDISADSCNVRVVHTSRSDVECTGWMYYRGAAPIFLVMFVWYTLLGRMSSARAGCIIVVLRRSFL